MVFALAAAMQPWGSQETKRPRNRADRATRLEMNVRGWAIEQELHQTPSQNRDDSRNPAAFRRLRQVVRLRIPDQVSASLEAAQHLACG